MDRRFLASLGICLIAVGAAFAGQGQPRTRSAVTYQAYQEDAGTTPTPEPAADDDGGGDEGAPGEWDGGYDDGGCDDGCDLGCDMGCCNTCCGNGWVRGEYLNWFTKGQALPTLVTTSPFGTSQANAGLGSTASVVIGDENVNTNGRSGARIIAGEWLDDCRSIGLEGSVFGLSESNESFNASSTGNPILARPFFNTVTNLPASGLIAFSSPNGGGGVIPVVAGSIHVGATSQIFGGEINIRKMLQNNCCYRLEMIGGYRYFYLNERLNINEDTVSTATGGTIPLGTTLNINDLFAAKNQFNGGQLGMMMTYNCNRWTLDILGKMAVGSMLQDVNISGNTTVSVPGQAPVFSQGGFLALDTNSGHFTRNRVSSIPELNLNMSYQMSPCWRINAGYTFMYVTNVIRPAEQIDPFIDPRAFPPSSGGSSPRFVYQDNDMWIQGVNAGLECRF